MARELQPLSPSKKVMNDMNGISLINLKSNTSAGNASGVPQLLGGPESKFSKAVIQFQAALEGFTTDDQVILPGTQVTAEKSSVSIY